MQYGGVRALNRVDVVLDEGEIVALMGPNGAGKSTVLKAIFGLVAMSAGRIEWRGKRIVPLPHEMVERGIAFVPQGRRVFAAPAGPMLSPVRTARPVSAAQPALDKTTPGAAIA